MDSSTCQSAMKGVWTLVYIRTCTVYGEKANNLFDKSITYIDWIKDDDSRQNSFSGD